MGGASGRTNVPDVHVLSDCRAAAPIDVDVMSCRIAAQREREQT